jgi:hypothetical protein
LTTFVKECKERTKKGNNKNLELKIDRVFSDIERIQILNNSFKNMSELLLKVPAAQHISNKQIKNILEQKN